MIVLQILTIEIENETLYNISTRNLFHERSDPL